MAEWAGSGMKGHRRRAPLLDAGVGQRLTAPPSVRRTPCTDINDGPALDQMDLGSGSK